MRISRKVHTNSLSIFKLENRICYFYLLEYRIFKKVEIRRWIRMDFPRISFIILYNLFSILQCTCQLSYLLKEVHQLLHHFLKLDEIKLNSILFTSCGRDFVLFRSAIYFTSIMTKSIYGKFLETNHNYNIFHLQYLQKFKNCTKL